MKKIDYKKQDQALYKAKKGKVEEIHAPTFNFLKLGGCGDPNGSELFSTGCEILFSVSYKIKFAIKKGSEAIDYGVMPLEGLWWVGDDEIFNLKDKTNWKWTLMIRQPDFVTQQHLDAAIEEVTKKKKLGGLSRLKLDKYSEGKSVQTLHVGPYTNEQPTIDIMHDYIDKNDLSINGLHHEIYLNDPTRTANEKLKTIIRQPVKTK